MDISVYGTGSILTSHLSPCILIDGVMLIDCPNGSIKALRKSGINPKQIDHCIITHFHADHCFDVPFLLLEQSLGEERQKDINFIGPPGLNKYIEMLFLLAYPEDWEKVKKKARMRVYEICDTKTLCVDDYWVTALKVQHGSCDAFGYTVTKHDKTVGFTGDSSLCPAVESIISKSNMAFVDVSFISGTQTHMGIDDVDYLLSKYSDNQHRILPTHMTDSSRQEFEKKYFVPPTEGDFFTL